MSVSALVLTLNEEINVGPCLDTLAWSNDVVVLDSLSTDATRKIAADRGARVVERPFDDWATHQNWAVRRIPFRNPWVFYIDADERCTPELRDEVLARALPEQVAAAFRVRRKDFYMGRWLRHAQLYPSWLIRLFRPEKIRYERSVNPVAIVEGVTEALEAQLLHYPFSHGVGHWIARHNRYSQFEASELIKVRANGNGSEWKRAFTRDPNVRRRALKDIFYRLPARPLVKFAYYAVWRRAFLDGRAGMTYAALQAMYEYMIDCNYRELVRKRDGLPL
jgi:glycosyltransferase involved in cell wall biosynthesis